MTSLAQFVESGLLLTDREQRVERTPLVEQLIAAYARGPGTTAIVATRQSGKSTGCAVVAAFELLCVPNSHTIWVAGSREQTSAIVQQRLRVPLARSGVEGLELSRNRLAFPAGGSTLECISTSEITSPGRRCSLIIFDEARTLREEDVLVLRPAIATGGRAIFIGSPGSPRSYWYKVVHDPLPEDRVITLCGNQNPAVEPLFVRRERERLSKTALGQLMAVREWGDDEGNPQWLEMNEMPLIRPQHVARATVERVAAFELEKDQAVIGVDLSLTRDLTSVVTVARRRGTRELRVVDIWVLDPRAAGGEVDLELVERRVELLARRYHARVVVDRYQAVSMCRRLRRAGLRVVDRAVSAQFNVEVFEALAECMAEERLTFEADERLRGELFNLKVEETSTSWRVVDADRRLHRDVAFSLALAVHAAERLPDFQRELDFGSKAEDVIDYVPPPLPSYQEMQLERLRNVEREYDRLAGRVFGGGGCQSA